MRSVLITGGNGGLGLAIGKEFLGKNSEDFIWLGVRENANLAEKLAAEFPGRCRLIRLDVTSETDWAEAIAVISAEIGGPQVLVNNAGHHEDHLLAMMPAEAWSRVVSSNLDSVFLGCRSVVPGMMRARFGRIINIASLSALLPPMGQTNYAAAKAGVVAFTRTLAKEVARASITVNAVLPGFIETAALAWMDEDARKRSKAAVPMRRFGRPEEVAAAVYFLASTEAAYITGASLKIDGGIY